MLIWSHGYTMEVPYTYGYYKETSPHWIKWASYLGGRKPPKAEKIRVLELGCGQGYNLCIHASAFPNIEFLGVDFNPSHISHAEELAELTRLKNVSFVEADFLELAKKWPEEYGKFQYVIIHGIWSWIAKNVREAVVEILKNVVLPAGLVYISYNALPGWLSGTILRSVFLNYQRATQKPLLQAAEEGIKLLQKLDEMNAIIFKAYPNIKSRLEMAMKQDKHYVVHEYMNETHYLAWVYEVIEEVIPAKLYYAANASLIDNYLPALFPDKLREFINEFPHPVFRLFLIDLFTNQTFRKDIYQKGELKPFPVEQIREIKNIKFICKEEPPKEFKFQLGFGEMDGKREIYEPIMLELNKGEKSIDELLKIHPFNERGLHFLLQALTLLMNNDLVGIYNEEHDVVYSQKFNHKIIKLVSDGRPYNYLTSPIIGLGIPISLIEMIIFDVLSEGVSTIDELTTRSLQKLKQKGQNLIKDGKRIEDPAEEEENMKQLVTEFLKKRLKKLQALKVIP